MTNSKIRLQESAKPKSDHAKFTTSSAERKRRLVTNYPAMIKEIDKIKDGVKFADLKQFFGIK